MPEGARRMQTATARQGLALAGGGPLGGIYELGALIALEESLTGFDLVHCDVYVGVSVGAVFASCLANSIRPRELYCMTISGDAGQGPFDPGRLLQPALREFVGRALALPPLFFASFLQWLQGPFSHGIIEEFVRVLRAIPAGMFDSAPLASSLAHLFAAPGRTDDFRKLRNKLFVVAAELDSSRSVPFGAPGYDDIPISRAVQASVALPGYYAPVSINGRAYVDGVLNKTLHASVALAEGVKLLICINPLVPFDRALANEHHAKDHGPLSGYGLPLVMSQTFRAIIHSRMRTAFGRYAAEYPDADIVLFEPPTDDPEMFFVNVFSQADRKRLCEHAYQQTRSELRRRADTLEPILAKHGVALNRATLDDATRTLKATVTAPAYSRLVSLLLRPFDGALARLEGALWRAESGASDRSPP